ncbi:MAG: endo alpha-1,4 polygalactosaminidase, partial [Pseudomonadota bacterium]|nr:endo alpha-1,4 polygalactosaminidase [Pseudomonadota bacterium]
MNWLLCIRAVLLAALMACCYLSSTAYVAAATVSDGVADGAATPAAVAPAPFGSVAFYYGSNPPLNDLQAFDIAVVDPDHVAQPQRYARSGKDGAHTLFAYVALGEVQPSRPYYRGLPAGALRTDNAAWGSKVIDQAAPGWRDYFLDSVIAPLWQQGWRGFFIDTLDSYQLFASTDAERSRQTAAMVATLREFKRRYPDARLMLNRGFELLPELAPITFAVAAESLYQGFDAGKNQYRMVPPADRDWLLAQLRTARETYHLPVISIEYVAPDRPDARELARATAAQVRQLGFVPWVADGALASVGVSNIEVVPRTVLVLVDNLALDVHYTDVQRYLGMPMNYLGLRYEFVDLHSQALPDAVLRGRYAGVVSWLDAGVDHPGLAAWFKRRIDEGVRIAVFDTFGFALDATNAATLGLKMLPVTHPESLTVASRDAAMMDFEVPALPDRARLEPIALNDAAAHSLLRLRDERGVTYDAAALTTWGGYALTPYTARSLPQLGADRWVLQPIRFLQAALQLPALPVPDVTTEGGRRMLMAHVDADGFASRAELPGAPFASAVMSQQILQ